MNQNDMILCRAPLRLGLAGGGTDIPPYVDLFGGEVLNCTINLYAHGKIKPGGNTLKMHCRTSQQELVTTALPQPPLTGKLVIQQAVYLYFMEKYNNGRFSPCQIETWCDTGYGSGLGASSALTVALIKGFCQLFKLSFSSAKLAETAYFIERNILKLKGGLQDQYAAAYGGLNLFKFANQHSHQVKNIALPTQAKMQLESQIVLIDSNITRTSEKAITTQSIDSPSNNAAKLQSLNKLKALVSPMFHALEHNDIALFWSLFNSASKHKHTLGEAVLPHTLNNIFANIMGAGALAGKVCGAGGGGFMMFAIAEHKLSTLKEQLGETHAQSMRHIKLVNHGAQALTLHHNDAYKQPFIETTNKELIWM
ncbi:hypothetical protein L1077_02010 [Pseudoalteromonas luteoviolacea]|uniref:GHMP family kinase ATP-binding protein n=1 Tax=Pseudoalteromonas luteoviolacea TaxID=43657 RepID=UPI001F46D2CA|nr:hypothetical protein [Pseudoalteromonas luteoviolacea]MCF6438207.1 hypothetical protein [Pseudoalteromonas luteoviolacea]